MLCSCRFIFFMTIFLFILYSHVLVLSPNVYTFPYEYGLSVFTVVKSIYFILDSGGKWIRKIKVGVGRF